MITIKEFLETRCTKVQKKEPDNYVDLMMDNHKCIQYGNKQYYVPDSDIFEEEETIYNFLIENYSL